MKIFTKPLWTKESVYSCNTLEEIPHQTIEDLKQKLPAVNHASPVVSVVIAAWNEEVNIIKCLYSLANSKTDLPFEIIVVNNNSTDRTQEVLDMINATSYLQPVQGVGISRELGQQKAKGKYILSADADCIYPPEWIDSMTKALMQEGVVFVYSRFSYLNTDAEVPQWKLSCYEFARDVVSEIRQINRPFLNVYGISLGYIRELGLKVGIVGKNQRGFDGRLCYDMMQLGKIKLIRSSKARAYTGTRAIFRDGSFSMAVKKRVLREVARANDYFKKISPHNTKESKNADYSIEASMKRIKKMFG